MRYELLPEDRHAEALPLLRYTHPGMSDDQLLPHGVSVVVVRAEAEDVHRPEWVGTIVAAATLAPFPVLSMHLPGKPSNIKVDAAALLAEAERHLPQGWAYYMMVPEDRRELPEGLGLDVVGPTVVYSGRVG